MNKIARVFSQFVPTEGEQMKNGYQILEDSAIIDNELNKLLDDFIFTLSGDGPTAGIVNAGGISFKLMGDDSTTIGNSDQQKACYQMAVVLGYPRFSSVKSVVRYTLVCSVGNAVISEDPVDWQFDVVVCEGGGYVMMLNSLTFVDGERAANDVSTRGSDWRRGVITVEEFFKRANSVNVIADTWKENVGDYPNNEALAAIVSDVLWHKSKDFVVVV